MKGLDLRKFKKVASDKDFTTLQHADGHSIKIAHKALSKTMKAELNELPMTKMADGGPVAKPSGIPGGSGSPYKDPKKAKDIEDSSQESGWQPEQWKKNIKEAFGMAKGGAAFKDGPVTPEESIDSDKSGAPDSTMLNPGDAVAQEALSAPVRPEYTQFLAQEQQKSNPQLDAVYGNAESRATADLNKLDQDEAQKTAYSEQQANIQGLANSNRTAAGAPPLTLPTAVDTPAPTEQPATPPATVTAPQTPPPSAASQAIPNDALAGYQGGQNAYLNNIGQAMREQVGGKYAEAQAVGAQGAAEAKALQQGQALMQHIQDTGAAHLQAVQSEMDNVIKDIGDGHIDPNHYLGSMSTPGKIATAIGLALGGFGASLTHGQNYAQQFVDNQIRNDIEAQKTDLGRKENLVSAYQRQYGNIRDATQMAMATQGKLVENQLLQAAAASKDPIAKARAIQFAGEIHDKYAGIPVQVAKNQALIQLTGNVQGNPERTAGLMNVIRVTDPEQYAKLQAQYLPQGPNKGELAKIPLTPEIRNELQGKQQLHDAAADLYSYVKDKGNSLSLSDRAVAEQKALILQSKMRDAVLNTVYKKGEQPLLDKAVSENPISFTNRILGTELPKLKEMIRANQHSLKSVRSSVGLPNQPDIDFTAK